MEKLKKDLTIEENLWDDYSRGIPEQGYDIEKDMADFIGQSVMLESDFMEALKQFKTEKHSIDHKYLQEQIRNIKGSVIGELAVALRENHKEAFLIALEVVKDGVKPLKLNPEGLKIVYSSQFLAWLKEEPIENQEVFSIQSLYEIYINSIMWEEIPADPELPKDHLKVIM